MNNVSLKDQLQDMNAAKYPFVRHDDNGVRANPLAVFNHNETGEEMVLAAFVDLHKRHRINRFDGRDVARAYNVDTEATIRCVTAEYFNNNFWEGKN